MEYHFKIHKDKNGFWAECIELKGCNTQAYNFDQLLFNASEALNLFLNESYDSNFIFPLPKKNISGKNIIKVHVDPKIAFAQLLRITRHKRGFSQKEVASMIGLKNIYSYQRLESPKKTNPALVTIAKIKKIFPELKLDLII